MWKRMIYHGEDLGDFYECSDDGQIRNVKTGKILNQHISGKGYYYAWLHFKDRKDLHIRVHVSVAETFLENPLHCPQVNHKNGDKLRNEVSNLEWITNRDNVKHAIQNNMINFRVQPVQCIETGETFRSLLEAGTKFKPENPEQGGKNIRNSISRNHRAYGYHWSLVN